LSKSIAVNNRLTIKSLVYVAFFTALTAVSSYISIPMPPGFPPFTVQTMAVMLTGLLLPAPLAGLSMLTFLLLGAIGAPVFAGGASGIGVIVGNTGGYLIGFMVGAMVISIIKGDGKKLYRMIAACIAGGMVIVYILGAAWLGHVLKVGFLKGLEFGVYPYILWDFIKAVLAALIAKRLVRHINL